MVSTSEIKYLSAIEEENILSHKQTHLLKKMDLSKKNWLRAEKPKF